MSAIAANLTKLRDRISSSSSSAVLLVAVSKLKPKSDILEAFNAGQVHFGENYVSELVEKCRVLPQEIRWHFIGHLQSNKVNNLIQNCPSLHMVESVDSVKLATKLDRAVKMAGREDPLKILVAVKTSAEETKSGISPDCVSSLVEHVRSNCPMLQFSGLMTIADPDSPCSSFVLLSTIKRDLESAGVPVEVMSMGMSGDFELAIEHGSTEVRVGSSIFGSRSVQ